MSRVRKTKLTGERSIASKLHRLAYELEHDAKRIKADHGSEMEGIADAIRSISSHLGNLARRMEA